MQPHERTRANLICSAISADKLFGGISKNSRSALAAIQTHLRILPETVVFTADTKPDKIYIHEGGRAVLYASDSDRSDIKALSICPVDSHQIYGLVEALSGDHYHATMKTLTPADFFVIDTKEFLAFLRHQPEVCFRLAEILSSLYSKAVQTIKEN